MQKILIVEDEVKLRNELKYFLETNGYAVDLITDFNDTTNDILKSNCDLILLDINLPNQNGEFICREIRKVSKVPIIIVTSKNNELDELISISYGADDFITKPYNSQILLARINRILSRINGTDEILEFKSLKLNMSKSIVSNNDKIIDLSKNELKILYYLLKNSGHIISRDDLMDYLWDNSEFVDDNTLTVNINRLRNKLESIGLKNVIITKRGQGYIVL